MGPSGPALSLNPNSDPPGNPPNLYIQPGGDPTSTGGGEQPLGGLGFLTTAPSSATALPLPPSSPTSISTPWRAGQAMEERSVEIEMRERRRSRPRDRARDMGADSAGNNSCENTLHPFLQQEAGRLKVNSEVEGKEVLFTQVFCCQPCDVIGQDFELPMQITVSPVPAPSSARSLEEELQEAIQRVQMAPSQSIDDILDEPISCSDAASSVSDLQAAVAALSDTTTPPVSDQSHQSVQVKEENFLSSPLCSSLLLELPPSPSSISQDAPPPPPPPPICTTPPPMNASRKRREAATFDPADWLESLTSGLRPLTPPAAPFVETDFGLDADLNVNRVLDLMVEQW
ncbi:hypothetical protein GJAV_G00006940 [Gymnothorax javanicus]|nr:hypothetical protein GJAV_G00006940 [Gymnothorax javanicus]